MSNPIEPPKVYPQDPIICVKFDVFVQSIVLNTSANIKVILYKEDNSVGEIVYLEMSGQSYLDWGSDDNYVIEWAKQQLNI